jgi:hypothetical protein
VASQEDHIELSVRQFGFSEPRFIIQYEGYYYVTLAVWPYKANAKDLTNAQAAIVKIVKDVFDQAQTAKTPPGVAHLVKGHEIDHVLTAGHTGPPHAGRHPPPHGGGGG